MAYLCAHVCTKTLEVVGCLGLYSLPFAFICNFLCHKDQHGLSVLEVMLIL